MLKLMAKPVKSLQGCEVLTSQGSNNHLSQRYGVLHVEVITAANKSRVRLRANGEDDIARGDIWILRAHGEHGRRGKSTGRKKGAGA
jgi:hypothetical protein